MLSHVLLPQSWEAGVDFVQGNDDKPGSNTYYVSRTVISALFTVPAIFRTTAHRVGR